MQNLFAQEEHLDDKTQSKIETVIVSATRTKSANDKHPDIFVLDTNALDTIQSQHIQELLVSTPGVSMQRGNGQEYLPAIRSPVFTGAGSCGAILTAEDGVPIRSAGFCNVNELFEAHSEAANQIEVVRGSGTALYGSNALHGMINVITPEPGNTASRISLEAGSDNYQRLKVATSLGQDKKVAGFLTLTTDGGFRDESGYDQQKLTLKYSTSHKNKNISAGLSLNNLNQETAGFIQGLDAYKDPNSVSSNPTPEAYRDAKSARGWLRFESQLGERRQLVVTPYFRKTDMQFLQHFLPGDPLEENGQTSIGFQSANYFPIGDNIDVISGLDADTTRAYLKQSQDQATQGSAFLMATIPSGKHYDYEVDANTLAAFLYADWSLTQQLNLISGVRYEHIDYDYDNLMLAGRTREDGSACGFGGCRYSRPANRSDSFNNLSSHLQLLYQITDNWQGYIKYANAYRVPQATELYRLQRDQLEAELDSETLAGFEYGVKYSSERLRLDVLGYSQNKDNHIFRDSDFFNVSNGETSHDGIEFLLDYQLTDAFSFALNTNFARHRYAYDQLLNGININGNDIDTAPEHFGSAVLNWSVTEEISSQLEYIYVGDYFLDPENLHTYPGHELLNLRSQWKLNPNWDLSMRLNNVLDTAYAERADFTSFTDERYFPGRGRSVFVSIEKSF